MRSVALDWGSRIFFCEVSGGQVVGRATAKSIYELEPVLGPNTPKARVAIECCREAWFVAEKLREWAHEPLLVDTTRVKQLGIGQHGRKNDRIDAEVLARGVEENRIPRAHELSIERQQLRMANNTRAQLVSIRSSLCVAIQSDLRARGIRLPQCNPENLVAKVERFSELPPLVKAVIEPLVQSLKGIEAQVVEAEKLVDRLCAAEPIIEILKTRPGVGPVVAAAFVAVVDNPQRFPNAHEVESYIGLVPSENTSGKRKLGSITKQGNTYLRSMLVQAAWATLRATTDDPLTLWGKAIAKRRNSMHIAAVAVARRLVGILWAMWRDDRVYDPRLLGQESAKGIAKEAESQLLRAQALKRAAQKRLPTQKPKAAKKFGTASAAGPL